MAKMTEKQKLLAIGGGAVGICLLAVGGVFWANGLIDEVQAEIDAKSKEIAAAEVKIAKIPALENDVIILRENLGEYVKILPQTQDLNDFVKMLYQFEQQSGIQTVEFKPGKLIRNTNSKVPEKFSRIEYEYEMTATLWQFMRFINFIENYQRFVSITDFTITPPNAREVELREGEHVYSMKLKMETYTYNSQSTSQDVEIPNYGKRRDQLGEEIFRNLQQLRIEKYEHLGQRLRRDIFVDPREREGRTEGLPLEVQRQTFDRLVGELAKLRELNLRLRRSDLTIFDQYAIEKALKDGIEKLDAAVQEVQVKQQITHLQLKNRLGKEVIEPLAEMRDAGKSPRDGAVKDPFLTTEELQQLIASMSQMLNEGDFEGADARFESVAPRVLVPEDDPRHALAVAAKALHVKVKTAMEFRTLKLKIQGVLVNHEGGRSGLILNGEVLEEGEYVSDELMIRRVEEEQVWFVFRGLTLIRTL